MELDELLGIDLSDPVQQLADQLVSADNQLLDQLVALRKASGLTQRAVAEKLGVDQSAIARIEAGERDPHLSTLRRYALAVGARVDHHVSSFQTTERHDSTERAIRTWASINEQDMVKDWVKPNTELLLSLIPR